MLDVINNIFRILLGAGFVLIGLFLLSLFVAMPFSEEEMGIGYRLIFMSNSLGASILLLAFGGLFFFHVMICDTPRWYNRIAISGCLFLGVGMVGGGVLSLANDDSMLPPLLAGIGIVFGLFLLFIFMLFIRNDPAKPSGELKKDAVHAFKRSEQGSPDRPEKFRMV